MRKCITCAFAHFRKNATCGDRTRNPNPCGPDRYETYKSELGAGANPRIFYILKRERRAARLVGGDVLISRRGPQNGTFLFVCVWGWGNRGPFFLIYRNVGHQEMGDEQKDPQKENGNLENENIPANENGWW